jgi:hypothetical protein
MVDSEKQSLTKVLQEAIPLQVHRKTNYPPMNEQLSGIFSELKQLRKANGVQLRKAGRVKKHLDVFVLDLWIAANHCEIPWRKISLDRNDYTKGTRYRKLYLKYDLFRGVLYNLIALGYIEIKKGFYDRSKGDGFQTRIKASDKLLALLEFDITKIERDPETPEEEIIIKKDENKKVIDYVDNKITNQMRENLQKHNNLLRKTNIGTDGINLRYKYDPTCITVKRVFNADDFGGRFYNGFWMNMPKEDRKKLKINNEEVCELDYSALHPRIAYALKGIQVNEDPYTIEGCDRAEVKKAFLVLFNCESPEHAINTMRSESHIKNAKPLLQKIEQKHEAISDYFYTPSFGMYLQRNDAWLAENIINRLTNKGIACLPVHDSFIVAKKYKSELRSAMEDIFYNTFSIKPIIK